MILRAPSMGDALDDIINGTDGGAADTGGSELGWWDKLNQTANTQGANSIISGIFSLFGGKTNPGPAGYPRSYAGGGSAGFPWGYVALGAGVLGVGFLVLRKR